MSQETRKAPRGQRPDSCLHCVLMTALEDWFDRHGQRENGVVIIDVLHAVSKLTECAAEIIASSNDRPGRRRALRFAHEALDANMKSQRTGKLVEIEIPTEH